MKMRARRGTGGEEREKSESFRTYIPGYNKIITITSRGMGDALSECMLRDVMTWKTRENTREVNGEKEKKESKIAR